MTSPCVFGQGFRFLFQVALTVSVLAGCKTAADANGSPGGNLESYSQNGIPSAQQFFANFPDTFTCTAKGKPAFGKEIVTVKQNFTREMLMDGTKQIVKTDVRSGGQMLDSYIYYPSTFTWYPQWQFVANDGRPVASQLGKFKNAVYNTDSAIDIVHTLPTTCTDGVNGTVQGN